MDLPPYNFRPVLPNIQQEQRPNIYRSNTLDDGTIGPGTWLIEKIKINSYIDLREEREFNSNSKLDQHFILKTYQTRNKKKCFQKNNSVEGDIKSRFHVRFITLGYYVKVFLFRLSWVQLYNVFLLLIRHLFTNDYEYQRYGANCFVNPLGISGFYRILLEDCPKVFKVIFSLMINEDNFPMLISCNLGKDRTGIVSAMLMKLVGYSNEEIIENYALSEKLLSPMKDKIHDFFANHGVNEEFEGSPPRAMDKMLHYLESRYGGVEGYILHCGLSMNDIDKIRRNVAHRSV